MKIIVNGQDTDTNAATLEQLLDEQGHGGAKLATAVNEVFVPATLRQTLDLKPGDRVEILAPMQGG